MNLAQDLIFRIKADVSNSEAGMGKVIRRTDEMKISTEKAGKAVRSLASILQSGQDPVLALASSFENLTRAFGLGLAGTVAVVGISQVIKSFIKDTEKMTEATKNLNSILKGLNTNIGSLDFSGAVKQIETIRNAVDEANAKLNENDSILSKIGSTIEETFLGGARRSLEDAKMLAKQAEINAKVQAETNLRRANEAAILERINPLEAKRLKLQEERAKALREAERIGAPQSLIFEIERNYGRQLDDIAIQMEQLEFDKRAKEQEDMDKMMAAPRAQRPSAPSAGMAGQPTQQTQTYESLITKLNEISARVQNIYDVAEARLGVPILKSAY
ncbi:MAG: hypothetical protein ACO3EZ_15405 [Prochlorotrichaceae cyanobacterium]